MERKHRTQGTFGFQSILPVLRQAAPRCDSVTNSHPEIDKVFPLRAYRRSFAKTVFGFVTLSQAKRCPAFEGTPWTGSLRLWGGMNLTEPVSPYNSLPTEPVPDQPWRKFRQTHQGAVSWVLAISRAG
jgi:hypothetical protein